MNRTLNTIIPDPSALTVHLHPDPDGWRWEVRAPGNYSLFESPQPAAKQSTAATRAVRWIDAYNNADLDQRCRLLGYNVAAVRSYLAGAA